MTRGQRGFTLLELMFGLAIGALIVMVAVAAVGRVIVDDREAIAAAAKAGLEEATVTERHDVLPSRHGCTYGDAVAFRLKGKDQNGIGAEKTVCCKGWFYGCEAK